MTRTHVLLQKGVIRNSLSNPYNTKLTLERFNFETMYFFNPLPITRWQILDSSKLKEFADNNFKFDENGRRLSERVENTVGMGEIARCEQFLRFPQCVQKACFPGASKGFIVWEWVKPLPNGRCLDQSRLNAFTNEKINVT